VSRYLRAFPSGGTVCITLVAHRRARETTTLKTAIYGSQVTLGTDIGKTAIEFV